MTTPPHATPADRHRRRNHRRRGGARGEEDGDSSRVGTDITVRTGPNISSVYDGFESADEPAAAGTTRPRSTTVGPRKFPPSYPLTTAPCPLRGQSAPAFYWLHSDDMFAMNAEHNGRL